MTPEDVLNQTADLIDRQGHNQGGYCTFDDKGVPQLNGPLCVMGAMNLVVNGGRSIRHSTSPERAQLKGKSRNMLMKKINELTGFRERQPVRWNDEPGRTKEEVVNALREAAQR